MIQNSCDEVQIPVAMNKVGDSYEVVLFKLPKNYFKEPFFIDSLAKNFDILKTQIKLPEEDELLARPLHFDQNDQRVFRVDIDDFINEYKNFSDTKKWGFIFHMSRCGSTLATQMLAHNERFFVLSEPTIINAVLDPDLKILDKKRRELLKSVVNALSACSPGRCEYFFIKFRSWNTLYIDMVLKEFPKTKWLFIHRNGLEVMSSVLKKPPGWLRSRARYGKYFSKYLNLDEESLMFIEESEYISRILGSFCESAKKANSDKGTFLDYRDLKGSLVSIIQNEFGITLTESEKSNIENISHLYSKDINMKTEFKPDSEEKRKMSTPSQREFSDKFIELKRQKLII